MITVIVKPDIQSKCFLINFSLTQFYGTKLLTRLLFTFELVKKSSSKGKIRTEIRYSGSYY